MVVLTAQGSARARAGHPWVWDGDIARVDGAPPAGAVVPVAGPDGAARGWGFWSPASRARLRMLGGPEPALDTPDARGAWLGARLDAALALRTALGYGDAARLVFGESDGLPGLVVDRYGGVLVVQLLGAGMEALRDQVVAALADRLHPAAVVERSDTGGREREGLPPVRRVLAGALPADGLAPFTAGGLALAADVLEGQKTGFYLDQRDAWEALRPLAAGRRILDVCCYTGAFGLSLLAGRGEALTGVDDSARGLARAAATAAANGLADRAAWVRGDAMTVLPALRAAGERFGFLVVDPSAYAKTRAHARVAQRAYAAMNAEAVALAAPGAWLYACSCTTWVGREGLVAAVGEAARRARRVARLVEVRGASRDHPVHPLMPETAYLTGTLWYLE